MNLAWRARRLARMGPAEVAGRVRDQGIKLWWRHNPAGRGRPRSLVTHPGLATPLTKAEGPDPEHAAATTAAADRVLAGHWDVLGHPREDLSTGPDWFLDPKTGRRAPQDRYAFGFDHRDPAVVGSNKHVWELSRHHHVTLLAAAAWLTGEARYATGAAAQLRSWWQQNPFLSGIHWTSGIEVGLRLVSWVWTRRLLDDWAGVADLFDANPAFHDQLYAHQLYLSALPSRGSSANNHIIAEAAGLFAASSALPFFPESDRWRRRAAAVLAREIERQTFGSGLNRELATGYHLFVLELALNAALEGEAAGHPLGTAVWDAIIRMMDTLAAVVDTRLKPPRQGDGDDGTALVVDHPARQPGRSLLATGRSLFGAADWWPAVPDRDVRTSLWAALGSPGADPPPRNRLPPDFADSGVILLRDRPGGGDEIWCRCDGGPHGYLATAAHAHADALSIEVRYGGVEILTDPGTYCYSDEPEWRQYFRSTIGHNTLELAGVDQSVSAGPFLWTKPASTRLLGSGDGDVAHWAARHDGYQRLRPPAAVVRRVQLDHGDRMIRIEDEIECSGSHPARLAFHLGPTVQCELEEAEARLSWGGGRAVITLPPDLGWERYRGGLDPLLGWYSPRFGVKLPTTSLVGTGAARGGLKLLTTLRFEGQAAGDPG